MRKIFLFLLISICMVSCLDKNQSHYTPQIRLSYFVKTTGDTLKVVPNEEKGIYVTDTIVVGDTVNFAFAGSTVTNNLQAVQIDWDNAALDLTIGPLGKMASVLLETSDSVAGKLYFPEGYNYVAFPVSYIARQESASSLKFTLSSDSKFSPGVLEVQCPVAKKKE